VLRSARWRHQPARHATSPRLTGRTPVGGGRTGCVTRLRGPDDVDDEVCDWLTAAYLAAPG